MVYKKFRNFTEAQSNTENILAAAYIEIGSHKIFVDRKETGFETTIQGKMLRFHRYNKEILTVGTALAAAIN